MPDTDMLLNLMERVAEVTAKEVIPLKERIREIERVVNDKFDKVESGIQEIKITLATMQGANIAGELKDVKEIVKAQESYINKLRGAIYVLYALWGLLSSLFIWWLSTRHNS